MRKRDIREQRQQHDAQRWQHERDDAEDDEVPDQDDEPTSWERSMQ